MEFAVDRLCRWELMTPTRHPGQDFFYPEVRGRMTRIDTKDALRSIVDRVGAICSLRTFPTGEPTLSITTGHFRMLIAESRDGARFSSD